MASNGRHGATVNPTVCVITCSTENKETTKTPHYWSGGFPNKGPVSICWVHFYVMMSHDSPSLVFQVLIPLVSATVTITYKFEHFFNHEGRDYHGEPCDYFSSSCDVVFRICFDDALGPGIQWVALWRHQMETFSALVALCAGNLPVTSGLPPPRNSNEELWCFFGVSLLSVWTNWTNTPLTGNS